MSVPRALQREWYAKLKASGFSDIETGADHDGLLKTDKRIEEGRGEEYQAQAEYYRRAGVFLNHHRWNDPRHRTAWALHAGGTGMNEIAKALGWGDGRTHELLKALRQEMLGAKRVNRGLSQRALKKRNGRAFFRWAAKKVDNLAPDELLDLLPMLMSVAR